MSVFGRTLGMCLTLSWALGATACRDGDTVLRESGLAMRYLAGCAPERVDRVTLEALGDFPSTAESFASFAAGDGSEVSLRRLPVLSQVFRLSVETDEFRGFALAPAADDGTQFDALVLPLGVHCEVGAEGLGDTVGAAATLLAGEDVLVAGGLSPEGLAGRSAKVLRVGRERWDADAQGLFVPRAYAAAVAIDQEAWIVGGASSLGDAGVALDSFERYDAQAGAFVGLGRLFAPRMHASALTLADGSVLVAGGQATPQGPKLSSLERILPSELSGHELSPALPSGTLTPTLLLRDDGRVAILGDDAGALWLALFDPVTEGLVELDLPPVTAPANVDPAATVVLPGARLAFLETTAGVTTGRLWVRLEEGSYQLLDDWLAPFSGLSVPRAAPLRDGRILLTGVRDGEPTARVIDPSSRDVRVRSLAAAVQRLLVRADGSVIELGSKAVLVAREDTRSGFDNPGGTLLASDEHVLALDARPRFAREALSLTAEVPGARFDLAGLRYEDVRVELRVQGAAELLLRRSDGAERVIEIRDERFGPAYCDLDRDPEAEIVVERSGSQALLRAGGGRRRCALDGLVGPIALAMRLTERGARVDLLVVTRR